MHDPPSLATPPLVNRPVGNTQELSQKKPRNAPPYKQPSCASSCALRLNFVRLKTARESLDVAEERQTACSGDCSDRRRRPNAGRRWRQRIGGVQGRGELEVRVAWSSEHALRFRLGKRISRDTGRLRAAVIDCGGAGHAGVHARFVWSFVRSLQTCTDGRTARNISTDVGNWKERDR